MMNGRIFTEDGIDEIIVSDIKAESGWLIGTLERMSCSGAIVSLLRRLEEAANQNLMQEADEAEHEIDVLKFLVVLGDQEQQPCRSLQLMNGTDVCFKLMEGEAGR